MFKCEFSTGNDAFEAEAAHEIVRLLAVLSETLKTGAHVGIIRDSNGNKIGAWSLTED